MRCFKALLLALAALLFPAGASAESLAPGRGPGVGLFSYAISTTTLDNGLRVAVVKTHFFAREALRKLAFTKHTFRHTALSFFEDIERMPERYAYSLRFFERFSTPDNVLLLIGGDVDAEPTRSSERCSARLVSQRTTSSA